MRQLRSWGRSSIVPPDSRTRFLERLPCSSDEHPRHLVQSHLIVPPVVEPGGARGGGSSGTLQPGRGDSRSRCSATKEDLAKFAGPTAGIAGCWPLPSMPALSSRRGVLGEVVSPRQAAIKAGLYDRSDGAYTNVVRDRAKSAAPRQVATTTSRKARR